MAAGLAALSLHLSACEARDSVFGDTYDECILKNVRGDTREVVGMVSNACKRRFEAPLVRPLATDATIQSEAPSPYIEFNITNNHEDLITTQLEAKASFYRNDEDLAAGQSVEELTWTFDKHLEPGERTSVIGRFKNGNIPSLIYTAEVAAARGIPLGSGH